MALVSAIIPVYNRRQRLQRAIESVLQQSYPEYELIVVDDGSTIDLSELCQQVTGAGHDWLKLEQQSGVATARNHGVANSRGSWIAFLDSDDDWHPEKLSAQIDWHQANPDYQISQVTEQWFRNDQPFTKPAHLQQLGGNLFAESVDRCVIGPSCVMMKRQLWDRYGGFNPELTVCEDYELWLRIVANEKVGLVEPALVNKRGGYSDQLSTTTPAMDSYRMVALAELLENHDLTETQTALVENGIEKRAEILAKGTAKRQREEWSDFFANLTVPVSRESIEKLKDFWHISREAE